MASDRDLLKLARESLRCDDYGCGFGYGSDEDEKCGFSLIKDDDQRASPPPKSGGGKKMSDLYSMPRLPAVGDFLTGPSVEKRSSKQTAHNQSKEQEAVDRDHAFVLQLVEEENAELEQRTEDRKVALRLAGQKSPRRTVAKDRGGKVKSGATVRREQEDRVVLAEKKLWARILAEKKDRELAQRIALEERVAMEKDRELAQRIAQEDLVANDALIARMFAGKP